jgi:general secretion pathway protein B
MSFILDALKKSESDRQRQGAPGLFEVKVAPPRSRLLPWAAAVTVLLVVNLVIVGWMLTRHPTRAAAADGAPAEHATGAPPPSATAVTPALSPGPAPVTSTPALTPASPPPP